jgi:hypothetical protein
MIEALAMDHDHRKDLPSNRTLPTRAQRKLAGAQAPIVGRLQRHGAAPYQFRRGEELSYYVDLLIVGEQKRIWGKDLQRALEQAETKPQLGDVVGVQLVARHAFTVTHRARDESGRVVSQTDREAHRNEWKIEKVQYFSARARAARLARDEQQDRARALAERPELKSTFLSLRAAQALAEQKLADPSDRARFLKLLTEAIQQSTVKNEPLPEPRLRVRGRQQPASPPRPRKRDDPVR